MKPFFVTALGIILAEIILGVQVLNINEICVYIYVYIVYIVLMTSILQNKFTWVCGPGFSIGYPCLKKIWSKTYPWLRIISWLRAHSYIILRYFIPNIPLASGIFRKHTTIEPQNAKFTGFRKKKYPWLRNSFKKFTLGLGIWAKKSHPWALNTCGDRVISV